MNASLFWISAVGLLLPLIVASPADARIVTVWQEPEILQSVPAASWPSNDMDRAPHVAMSNDGARAYALWTVPATGGSIVYAATANVVGSSPSWSSPVALSGAGQNAAFPRIAIAPDGTKAVAAWTRFDGTSWIIQTAVASATGGSVVWSPSVDVASTGLISRSLVQAGAARPEIAMSADGSVAFLVWANFDQEVREYSLASAVGRISGSSIQWSKEVSITDETTGFDLPRYSGEGMPNHQVVVSSDGTRATAVWRQVINDEGRLVSATAQVVGTSVQWGPLTLISTAGDSVFRPAIAASPDVSRVVAVWQQEAPQPRSVSWTPTTQAVWVATATFSGATSSWTPAQVLESSYGDAQDLRAAVSSDGGRAVIAWSSTNGMAGFGSTTNSVIRSVIGDVGPGGFTPNSIQSVSDGSEATGNLAMKPQVSFWDNDRSVVATWVQVPNSDWTSKGLQMSQRSVLSDAVWDSPQWIAQPMVGDPGAASARAVKRAFVVWVGQDPSGPVTVQATASEDVDRGINLSARSDKPGQARVTGTATGLRDGTLITIQVSTFNARTKKWSTFRKAASVTLTQGAFAAMLTRVKTPIQVKAISADGTESATVTLQKRP